MKHTVIKNDLLKPKSWLKVATLRITGIILFLFYWGFASGQPAISFKESSQAYTFTGSGNFPEMTIKNLNPVAGSAIYWEFFDDGVWRRYGGNRFVEQAEQIGDYRAWYKHGFLGTYAVTNTLTVISRKKKLIPSVNADLPEMSNLPLLPKQDKDNPDNALSKITPTFEPTQSPNNQPNNLRTERVGFGIEPSVYPNPCMKNLNVEFDADLSYSLMVYNDIGELIFTLHGLKGKTTLQTEVWKKGVYMIQIQGDRSTNISSSKVIKI